MVDAAAVKADLKAQASKAFPSYFFVPNGKQEEFMRTIGAGAYRHYVLSAANGLGKTALLVNILAQIVYGQHGPWTKGCPLFEKWPYPKRGRLLGTTKNVSEEVGAVDAELKKWLTPGTYTRSKGNQKYYSLYQFPDYDWSFDIMTYEQAAEELAGPTLGFVAADEPMPAAFWGEVSARLRGGGIFMQTMTPIGESAWMFDIMEEKKPDWYFQFGDVEDGCKTHGVRGVLEHIEVQRMIDSCPPEEREARLSGKFMCLSGLIYRDWGDKNLVVSKNGKYALQVEWELANSKDPPVIYQIIDPHDVKPWVIGYFAVYRDGRKVLFREWPDETMKPYHEMEQMRLGLNEYVMLLKDMERKLRIYKRVMDRQYGFVTKIGSRGATSIANEMKRLSKGELVFQPSRGQFEDQHHLVESAIMETETVLDNGKIEKSPTLLAARECRNFDYAMKRYMWKKNRGQTLDEKARITSRPQEKYKCFPNLVEYLMGENPRWRPPEEWLIQFEEEDSELVTKRNRVPVATGGGRVWGGYST